MAVKKSTRARAAPATKTTATSAMSGTSTAQSPPRAMWTRAGLIEVRYVTRIATRRPTMSPKRIDTGGAAALTGGRALFLLDRALALDAIARER